MSSPLISACSPQKAVLTLVSFLFVLHAPLPLCASKANDIFEPLIKDIDQGIAPQTTPVEETTIIKNNGETMHQIRGGRQVRDGVVLEFVTFKSAPVFLDGAYHDDTEVFCIIAIPQNAQPDHELPGILLLHGGGGSAQVGGIYYRTLAWAKAGYVAVSCDLPGIAGDKGTISSGTWRSVSYNELTPLRFTVTPEPKASWIYTAEATALKAFALLKTQPEVNPKKLGIVGESWGGYSTTMLCGLLGDRVEAGFSVWGSGFYDEDSDFQKYIAPDSPVSRFLQDPDGAEIWLTNLDAGRRADNIKAHFYIAAAANDGWFMPPAVTKTYQAITSAKSKNLQFSPNTSHQARTPGGSQNADGSHIPGKRSFLQMEEAFFDYYLKGEGKPLPSITIEGEPASRLNGSIQIEFTVDAASDLKLQEPELYYSTPTTKWPQRKWIKLDETAQPLGGDGLKSRYELTLPKDIAKQDVDWFILISDVEEDRVPTTVSTVTYHLTEPLFPPVDS